MSAVDVLDEIVLMSATLRTIKASKFWYDSTLVLAMAQQVAMVDIRLPTLDALILIVHRLVVGVALRGQMLQGYSQWIRVVVNVTAES